MNAVKRRGIDFFGAWFLVVSGLLCFEIGILSSYFEPVSGAASPPGAAQVQHLVQQATATARREAEQLLAASQPPQALSFGHLLEQSTYPTFLYEAGQLRQWSSAGPLPTATELSDLRPEHLAHTSWGDFVVVRRAAATRVALVYVPLTQQYGISNRYLRAGAGQALLQGLGAQVQPLSQKSTPAFTISEADGTPLFAVEWLPGSSGAGHYWPLLLLSLGVLLYLGGWLVLARRWWRAGRTLVGALALLGPLVALRLALLRLDLPYAVLELPLFDPRVYAVASWAPSLGDLLLNALLALVLAGAVWLLSKRYRWATRAQAGYRRTWGIGLGLVFGLLVLGLHSYYCVAFSSGQLSLDITQSIQVTSFRFVLGLAVVLHTAAFIVLLLLITQLLGPGRRLARSRVTAAAVAATALLVVLVSLLLGWPLPGVVALSVCYLALVRAAGPAPLGRPYQLLLLLALSAATGALALYEQFNQQVLSDKQRLASNLLEDNDLKGEFLLGGRIRELAADPSIAQLLSARPVRVEALRRRISRQYLRDYFDKYEADIRLFDAAGQPISTEYGDTLTFGQTRELLSRTATATDQRNVYLLKSANSFSSRRYAAVVPLVSPPQVGIGPPAPAGTIVLTLSLRKLSSYSVLPELLVDQKFFQPGLATNISYAGYAGGRLVYSEGDFDYANQLPVSYLTDARIDQTGLVLGGFHHLAVRSPDGRTVVVTTATYSLADGLSNFSFQLLINGLLWLVGGGVYLLRRRDHRRVQFNFSARIQVLLNVGILLSLVVVSVATASQVISGYRRDLHRNYERRGRIALESLLRRRDLLADSAGQPASYDPALAGLVRNVATLTETDLNLYDARGQLLVSSQPLIFEAGLLGPLLNPQAVAELRERGLSRVLLTEQAGSLAFSALYLPVRLPGTSGAAAGPLLGYVGIPFFDSQKELDIKLTELFTTILNIFTIMGLLFLGLAFVATRQLTAPLKLLTERLRRTTLTGQNEVLAYQSSDDEIGLLVREYNAMLEKLEASKRELAAQEKEAAWREMARQVAHEIKNPLTPMKLSLQYLQKAINERRPNMEDLIGRISQTLITQIDVLSDIATSFSTFTNLPTMRPERLDVGAVLQHCTDLFRQQDGDELGELYLELPPGACVVFADESLLVRTFNNLLLNARQAVPPGRVPRQQVTLRCEAKKALIAIADNGSGIADDVQDKVFRPNFTTKATGSGIGLAVAKRGIESAGGSIWFETVVGEGTTFFIELPLAG
ncbi:MAG TPA: HAMP domain-containing sensor histidine kinase [Hymenobacter sp.]|uniref:sensor histidine kinase n=1 Tax=Hymenobacter sp. TaxID=1898978 RepID=UPI002D7F6F35|nr:HAMP domain-containing sensor histidine kinase [Hymenobacter sp.]HET9502851.1 HAMP domain-containing sensor histidine kinase [Hymenobacter sp.]